MNRLRIRNRHLLALDALSFCVSCVVAFTLRFEGMDWVDTLGRSALVWLGLTLPLRVALLYSFGLYRRLWQHASVAELERVVVAGFLGGTVSVVLGVFILPAIGFIATRIPLGVVGLDVLFTTGAVAFPRFMWRVMGWRTSRRRSGNGKRVVIVGAGSAGQLMAREMFAMPLLGLHPIGFVDDDPVKQGHKLLEIPVLGTLDELPEILEQYDVAEVVIAMPTASGSILRGVVRAALEAGVDTRTVPGISEILAGRRGVTALRQVEIQDLLRREPINTNFEEVRALVQGRVIMVTGAGGSIGGELCRQVARLDPAELVLLGHGENSIFEIRNEIARLFPGLDVTSVIADIRDRPRIDTVFQRHAPNVVFHAAAHKHVPLMEANVIEAVTNNVIGTRNVVAAAGAVGTMHVVLISTDKAVRPVSVMGATKRIAEQIVQLAAAEHGRHYVAVRFGNVLGSRGSVVPTFMQQIRAGGPVLVTHPDMSRYFMTIPEAVQLVLQAGSLGQRGEVFVLDMGEPVKIVDLACDLIRLSGLRVGTDVEIHFTGRRPGEKLFEEMFFGAELVQPTEHPKVLRARNAVLPEGVLEGIEHLIVAAESGDGDEELRRLISRLVPDFMLSDVPDVDVPDDRRARENGSAAPREVVAGTGAAA